MEPYACSRLPAYETVGGVARRATEFKEMTKEHPDSTLILDDGDVFTGSAYFSHFQGEAEMKILTELNYEACALGNHDVDAKPGLPRLLEVAEKFAPNCPILNGNVIYSETKELIFKPYKIFTKLGVRIGVASLLGEQAWSVTSAKDSLEYLDFT